MPDDTRRAWRHWPAWARMLLVGAIVLGGDLWLKTWSFEHVAGMAVDAAAGPEYIPHHDAYPVVPKVMSFKLVLNQGAVFGLGRGQRGAFVLIGVVAAAAIGMTFIRSRARQWVLHTGLALVLAGALGNLYDRVQFGAVRDMCYLFPEASLPFGWTWPGGRDELYPWVFNIADVALLMGLGLLLIVIFRSERAASKQAAAKTID